LDEQQPSPESTTQTWDLEDRAATEFENALIRGEKPSIRKAIECVEPEARKRLLAELVGIEIVHRRRAGDRVELADYEPDFPELRSLTPEVRDELINGIAQSMQNNPRSSPTSIGRYTIVASLAEGRQAETFRAVHPGFQSTVVLKLAKRPADPGMIDRIAREGRLLASLPQHPHLVRVHDVDFYDGRVYLVLEDVPGRTLEQYARNRPLDARWAAQVVASIARAVHVAHQRGIVHQDLKPNNVLIDPDDQPRVIDFGVAWYHPWWTEQEDPSQFGGTPNYISPEQASGQVESIGPATDVFGLGAILYFLLTKSSPYPGRDQDAVLEQARAVNFDRSLLDRPEIPPRLREICLKALAKEPGDRFTTAADFAQALESFLAPRRWSYRAILAGCFLLAVSVPLALTHIQKPPPKLSEPELQVQVWRPDTKYQSLLQALPVHTGDELQVRFHAPRGLHLALFSINGQGRLSLLQQYPPQETAAVLVYPGPDQTRSLQTPEGTETLLLCGRSESPLSEAELQAAWGESGVWPVLDSPRRLLRVQRNEVREEGERSRDFGATNTRPRSDTVAGRLDEFRERLMQRFPFFEGLAFAHQ
jgi:eukaryotic-like serine/threonine-protein kinase